MTCAHCHDASEFFGDRMARRELKRFRRKGPLKTTRALLDALLAQGVEGRTVLDIGGGVGAVQHELLASGASHATGVDASTSYQEAARQEAARRGHLKRTSFYLGDFVEVAPAVPEADVVTLDRVICCYPDMPALVGASAGRAKALWGAVFPRERLAVRLGVRVVNFIQRLRRKAFRVYVHPTAGVEDVLQGLGFTPLHHSQTVLWQVVVWKREGMGG